MRAHWIPSAVVLLSACPRAAENPDAAFWSWFTEHQSDVAGVGPADSPAAMELARHLHAIDKDLTFELGTSLAPREIVISADGLVRAFPIVKRLVAAAPAIPGWKVIAFRQRHPGLTLDMANGIKLRAEDIVYKVLGSSNGTLDIAAYAKTMTTLTNADKQAIFLELDAVLGEYDVETRLGEIHLEPGSGAPPGARPLGDLAAAVDALK